jgi:hypothetical protein
MQTQVVQPVPIRPQPTLIPAINESMYSSHTSPHLPEVKYSSILEHFRSNEDAQCQGDQSPKSEVPNKIESEFDAEEPQEESDYDPDDSNEDCPRRVH